MARQQIHVLVSDPHPVDALAAAARQNHCTIHFAPLDEAVQRGLPPAADAFVLTLNATGDSPTLTQLWELISRSGRACLVLAPERPGWPPEHAESFTWLAAANPEVLADGLAGLLSRSRRDAAENDIHPAEPTAGSSLPALESPRGIRRLQGFRPLAVDVLFAPSDLVSGDTFDVRRLDHDHVGVVIADATGHGIPAALLSVLVRQALRGQRERDGHESIHAPDEVLRRLNEDLLAADDAEQRFAAATYALVNSRTGLVAVARAGSPYPLLRRRDGSVELLKPAGGVLGIIPGAEFAMTTTQLAPGDQLLVYTDGLDALLGPELAARGIVAEPQTGTTTAADEEIRATPWFGLFESEGATAALLELQRRHRMLAAEDVELDDLTVLALGLNGETA
jgi:hypothetical protein